jgi:Tfp pilus assembly protein PilN
MKLRMKKTGTQAKKKVKRRRSRTALGVDITEDQISLAFVKQHGETTTLIGAMRAPVPAGCIEDGHITDPGRLQKAIVDLKGSKKWKVSQTVLSFSVKPLLVQTMEMPKSTPSNIGQYVQREIKQCVALAGEQILSDYTGLSSANGPGRLLAVATDSRKVDDLIRVCQQARVDIDVVEPGLMGIVRALYERGIVTRFGCNLLFVILRDDQLTLCVFRRQAFDYVRIRDISAIKQDPQELASQLGQEVHAVLQYYEIEVMDSPLPWEINVITDAGFALSADFQGQLERVTGDAKCEVIGTENIGQALALDVKEKVSIQETSVAAIGHALRLLTETPGIPLVNLMPLATARLKSAKQNALYAAVAAAMILLFMGLAVMGLMVKTDQARGIIAKKRPHTGLSETAGMVDTRKDLEARIERNALVPKRLKEILNSRREVNWSGFLADVRDMTPDDLQITRLESGQDQALVIDGLAMTRASVTAFMNRLNRSEYVVAAKIKNTEQESAFNGVVNYKLHCTVEATAGI